MINTVQTVFACLCPSGLLHSTVNANKKGSGGIFLYILGFF